MIDKLRGSTTISTEHRTYMTDALAKKSISRATVSARSSKIEQRDVEVTQTQPHIITKHSNKFLQITSTYPVIATFIPGTPEIDVLPIARSTYTTGVIYAEAVLDAGKPLKVSVYDPDIVAVSVQVTVFNATTGETEFLTLLRLENGIYQGEIRTFLCRFKGEDFDGFMNCQPTDTIKVMYNDGRGSNGEPTQVIHQLTVISSVPVPSLFVRRAAPVDGLITVSVLNIPELTPAIITVTDQLSNTVRDIRLVYVNGEYTASVIPNELNPNIDVGDMLLIEFTYTDIFGIATTLTAHSLIGLGETMGVLTAPSAVSRFEEFMVQLDDPDVDVPYVDLILSGVDTRQFLRWRAMRVAAGSGLYRYTAMLPKLFDNDSAIIVTYADQNAGTPKLIVREIGITDIPYDPAIPVPIPGQGTNEVMQLALQLEINGLFTLNGCFSGIIKLRAKENETVRCSIVQAS